MTIEEMIKRYDIRYIVVDGNDKIGVANPELAKREGRIEDIRNHKAQIIQWIQEKEAAEKAAYEDRERKIGGIEGLAEIRQCYAAWDEYHFDFQKMMDTGRSYMTVPRPAVKPDDLRNLYPRADAYLKAEQYAHKSNYELSAIGKRALERIINGEEHTLVMQDMEEDLSAFTEKHIWD